MARELVIHDDDGSEVMKLQDISNGDWKDIPVELLLQILALLDGHSLTAVSRACSGGREPLYLTRSVILASAVCSSWKDAVFSNLSHLSLSWCKENMNSLISSLAPKLTKLKALTLRQDKPQLEDNAVQRVASYCHDLRELDLSKSFKLTDHSLYALAHGCPNLTKLNISGCSAFSDVALAYLMKFCRNLEDLNLCGCARAATDLALQAIGENCSKLQVLNLGWCELLSDKSVTCLGNGCPDLRALDLCGCILITDESVVALADGCPHLRSLGLYFCQNITDRAMYSLAQSRVKRKPKVLRTEEGLKQLNISQCTALTPPAVQALCDSSPALHTCPQRHSLMMSGCLHLTSVHCACAVQAHRVHGMLPHTAH